MSTRPISTRFRNTLFIAIGAALATLIVVFVIAASRSGTGGHYSDDGGIVTVKIATIDDFGPVLVTDQGYALYMFPPDEQSSVTCVNRCAGNWPPMFVPAGDKVVAGPGVDAELLSTISDASGRHVASYNGWPLYTYLGDVVAGTATGQGQYLDGGYWYLIRSNGDVVKPNSGT